MKTRPVLPGQIKIRDKILAYDKIHKVMDIFKTEDPVVYMFTTDRVGWDGEPTELVYSRKNAVDKVI